MLLNCGVGEDSECPVDYKEIHPVHPKGNQSWMFTEGLMLKLKFQYFGHLMRRADSFKKTLMLGKMEGRRRGDDRGWDGWMVSPTQWTWICVDSGSWWWTRRPCVLPFTGSQKSDTTEQLNWTDIVEYSFRFLSFFSFGFLSFCFWWVVFLFFLRRYSTLNVES